MKSIQIHNRLIKFITNKDATLIRLLEVQSWKIRLYYRAAKLRLIHAFVQKARDTISISVIGGSYRWSVNGSLHSLLQGETYMYVTATISVMCALLSSIKHNFL